MRDNIKIKIKYYTDEVAENEKSIALCGPTPRDNKTTSWRVEALQILEKLGFEGTVYVPEYSSGQKYKSYVEQVEWERKVYLNCTIMVFWIPRHFPDMPGLTTNVEFGYWLKSGKCIYGRPENAERTRYLDWLYNLEYNKKPYNNLEELLHASIILLNKKNGEIL